MAEKIVSIVIPVLNSHEVVRRQLLHFERMGIPEDTEIILVDDGSDPQIENTSSLPVTIHRTNDKRPWTWALARNAGARIAKGRYLIMVDLDHIITRPLLDQARIFDGDHIRYFREFAVLDDDGNFTQDVERLIEYGFPKIRLYNKGVKLSPHRNQFTISKELFWRLGGYREDRVGQPYPQREDGDFSRKWDELQSVGGIRDFDDIHGYINREVLYMFPNGKYCGPDVDFNPKDLFHKLSRKTNSNPFHRKHERLNNNIHNGK